MIIDGSAGFRSLLMHHVTTHWPDAVISAYDPTTAGHLPDEFSGAGNQLVLLGDQHGDRQGIDVLKRLKKVSHFPPVVYFGDAADSEAALETGADAFYPRDDFGHDELAKSLGKLLSARERSSLQPAPPDDDGAPAIDPVVKGYELLEKLSASAHSAVYLARREGSQTNVALKVLSQVPDVSDMVGAFDRFLQEYEVIADIDHPNIVKIFDLGVADDHAHIAMEFFEGGDLKARIGKGVGEERAVSYLKQTASALAQIHDVGILHRDLKPGNIMFRADDTLALIDFGLAKRMRLKLDITDSGEIFGTPHYMSPEQGHAGKVDARSDIYSLGIIFYEMLTGEKPYKADAALGLVYLHANAPIPELPPGYALYQGLFERMLAKDPEDRLQSAHEVLEWV